ncbi:hypothetical protein E2I00_019136, partial [Balaenoptera physalus]
NTVSKLLEKVRKVSVNVKTVRGSLERQAGQIKKLEVNEAELLRRRNFKVMIYQPKKKLNVPSDLATPKIVPFDLLPETEPFDLKPETVPELPPFDQTPRTLPYYPQPGPLPTPEEPTAGRDVRTRRNVQDEVKLPAKVSIGKSLKESEALPEKEGDELAEGEQPEEDAAVLELSSDEAVEVEEVIEESRAERIKRSGLRRTAVYRVPPFTFHVKKIRGGEVEVLKATEMV